MHRLCGAWVLVVLSLTVCSGTALAQWKQAAGDKAFGIDQLRHMRRDRHIDVTGEPGAVSLVPFELLCDSMGYTETGVFNQSLSERVWAKKELLIDDARARWAQLYFAGASDKTRMEFNGTRLKIGDPGEWAYGNWAVVDVPVERLRQGLNDVVFSGTGTLYVDHCLSPDRSACSLDGGKTWDYDHLGTQGMFNGEYMVRLGLGRYPKEGVIWSDGIELAALAGPGLIRPAVRAASVSLAADVSAPEGTAVRLELRSGTTPEYDPELWDAWRPAAAGEWLMLETKHRYVQWRALLSTTDPLRTPLLRSVTLAARLEALSTADDGKITVARFENQRIVRSSYHFVYQRPSARLGILRKMYDLDGIVAGAKTELETFTALRPWTRHQWDDGWEWGELGWCAPMDALVLLDMAPRGKVTACCGHFAHVFVQCSLSLGYTGRIIAGRAHGYAEVWSNQFGKWIIMDVGPGGDDEKELNYHYEYRGIPMNSLELHKRLLEKNWEGIDVVTSEPANDWAPAEDEAAMRRYLYVRIPFRNNQLDTILPGFINSNGWLCDIHWMVWRDGAIQDVRRDYLYTTNREGDLYWTLNQVAVYPSHGEAEGGLHLEFDTHTPNFKSYQVRIDGGEWTPCGNTLEWGLHEGRNLLEARTLNAFDVPGIVSLLEVDYVP